MADRPTTKGPKQRTNHRLLILSGLLGGVIGGAWSFAAMRRLGPDAGFVDLLTSPVPAWFAVVVALMWGVLLPIIAWRWHRVADEHEVASFLQGTLAAFYFISCGGAVWWFLWLGGLMPPVSAPMMYLGMLVVSSVVWLFHKFR